MTTTIRCTWIGSALCISLLAACGSNPKTATTEPEPPTKKNPPLTDVPPLPQDPPKTTPENNNHGVWAAFGNSLIIKKYDNKNTVTASCDLSKALPEVTAGGITALAQAKENTLLGLVDPGQSEEKIIAINTNDCSVSPWFDSNPRFSGLASNKLVSFPAVSSEYIRVFVSRETGVDRFTWVPGGLATRATGPGDSPFVPPAPSGAANCAAENVSGIGQLGEGDNSALLVLTYGSKVSRLNVVGSLMGGSSGAPQCLSSFNYASEGQPTDASDKPAHALQTNDKRVYVLFANSTRGAKLVRYDFNGTSLSSPFLLSQDQDDLGFAPSALAAISSSQFMIATGQFLSTIDITTGRLVRRLNDAPWTTQISALARE